MNRGPISPFAAPCSSQGQVRAPACAGATRKNGWPGLPRGGSRASGLVRPGWDRVIPRCFHHSRLPAAAHLGAARLASAQAAVPAGHPTGCGPTPRGSAAPSYRRSGLLYAPYACGDGTSHGRALPHDDDAPGASRNWPPGPAQGLEQGLEVHFAPKQVRQWRVRRQSQRRSTGVSCSSARLSSCPKQHHYRPSPHRH